MKFIFSLTLLVITSINAMDNVGNQEEESLLPYPELIIAQPPTTPPPLEIKRAKRQALKIVESALDVSSSSWKRNRHTKLKNTEDIFKYEIKSHINKLIQTPEFKELVEKYVDLLKSDLNKQIGKHREKSYYHPQNKIHFKAFWEKFRKELCASVNSPYDNKFVDLTKNIDGLDIKQLTTLKIKASQAKFILHSYEHNRRMLAGRTRFAIFTATLFWGYLIYTIIRGSKMMESEDALKLITMSIFCIAMSAGINIYAVLSAFSTYVKGDFEDISDIMDIMEKVNEAITDYLDPEAIFDENEGPEISEIV